jgi:cytidylate kinase
MAIITISRGSYSKGKEVAEKVGERLGYECISREVLLEASQQFNIPEVKLVRAIHDAPSALGRFAYGKEKYVSFAEAAILRHFKNDNVVYYGLAGHFFVRGVSHVLKVRILADFEDRVRLEMEREGISEKEAAHVLQKDDEERRKWSRHLYGIDTHDPTLYDLVIHIKKIPVAAAVDMICNTVALQEFKSTPESQKMIENLALAAEVRAAVIHVKPDVRVVASDGNVWIKTAEIGSKELALEKELERIAASIPGVKHVDTAVRPKDIAD